MGERLKELDSMVAHLEEFKITKLSMKHIQNRRTSVDGHETQSWRLSVDEHEIQT